MSRTKSSSIIKPDFLIIGAQKCGTTWLWAMLKQHPRTGLPLEKEIDFFGSSEIFGKGKEWYYSHFTQIDPYKVTGEASTTYLYDYVPYWYNSSNNLEYDYSLPKIPELITQELPDIKIIILLRDPVQRAISAYKHLIRVKSISPFSALKKTAMSLPKKRILEYGFYAKYIKLWKQFVPSERMRVYIFEEDIIKRPEETLKDVFSFLNLDIEFKPINTRKAVYKSLGWSQLLLNYYMGKLSGKIIVTRAISNLFNGLDNLLNPLFVKKTDIEFLRSIYLPEKEELENVLQRKLDCWKYNYGKP
ncbi:MAG: sulfotransferase [Nitrospirae bacterium]|nr:sulfotransferase [Nitrospirota bacterium]